MKKHEKQKYKRGTEVITDHALRFEPDLQQQNNYLISFGPLLAIACLLNLRFQDKFLTISTDFNLNFSSKTLKIINIFYWLCILIALIRYHQASPYHRPPIFFICNIGTNPIFRWLYIYQFK